MKINDHVRVVNFRNLAFNRTGIVIHLTGGRKQQRVTINFSDLPQLGRDQLKDRTGLTACFDTDDLETIEPIERELKFNEIGNLSASQLDTIINRIREDAKSQRSTRYSIQIACHHILDLLPSYSVNLKADQTTLIDYVDSALIALCRIRDERDIEAQIRQARYR